MRRRDAIGLLAASPLLALSGAKQRAADEAGVVVFQKTFTKVDFTNRPPHIYISCTFNQCDGFTPFCPRAPYPQGPEFYYCNFIYASKRRRVVRPALRSGNLWK